ncbi:outer membrane beta-barrel protein [Brumimicrobium aurantiacum]|uniref:Outer membrane protein beta-barrel domain-containing protein n=1 Tax=Brumimicrobium aurantiacum TaxID=1737063 RepID=A0A3E1F0H0_9FLAO|nr:outer membrane beta-barrel protein [Brumimicrobium aurantiacum]RFC55311.1 hypothetical protein DXU93_05680 [Brumimicrobium aurantiacum]
MKIAFTILAALLITTFSFAQEEKERDTTKVKYKGKVVIFTSDDEEPMLDEDKKWDVSQWEGIEFGVNGFFTSNDFGINDDPNNLYLELDYAKSLMINLNLFEFNRRIGSEKFRFYTGLGLRFNRYAFKSTNSTLSYNDTSIYSVTDSVKTFDKNYLNTSYLTAPLFLSFMPGKDPNKSFHVSVGAIVNYRIGSRIKQKYVIQDQKRKDIEKGHYHLNPFLLDASVRIGVGDVSIFANYGMNGLFESGKGPDYIPFNAGISLTF